MTETLALPFAAYLRGLLERVADRPPDERDSEAIFSFYERLKENAGLNPEEFLRAFPASAHCLPVVYLFHAALENNRDARHLGHVLDGYELKYLLGGGGMGQVYFADGQGRGRSPRLQAVKVIPFDAKSLPNLGPDRRAARRRRAKQEADALDRVGASEHLVRHYGACDDPATESVFIRLEYIDGLPLDALIDGGVRPGPLPPGEAVALVLQACLGLGAMHRAGVIHRDVKPSNLMIDESGRLKVTDLGLAGVRSWEGAGRITRTGEGPGGTPGYVAPEQIFGGPTDARADVYSLGWTLFDLARARGEAGRPPGGYVRPPLDPSGPECPSLPPGLALVIARATAHEPRERLPSVEALGDALERLNISAKLTETLRRFGEVRACEDHLVNIWVGEDLARGRRGTPPATAPEKPRRFGRAIVAALAAAAAVAVAVATLDGPRPAGGLELPGHGRAPAADRIRVAAINVRLFARISPPGVPAAEALAVARGVVGRDCFGARRYDQVTVEAKLSRRAYAYVVACRPDGAVELCSPESEDEPPPLDDAPRYPGPASRRALRYGLSEGSGLWVFVVAASADPLPPFRQWAAGRRIDWRPSAGQNGRVWWDDGQWLDLLTPGGPERVTRGKGDEAIGGGGPVVRVTDSFRSDPAISAAGIGFFVEDRPQ